MGRLIERDRAVMRRRNFPEWPAEFVPSEDLWREYEASLWMTLWASVVGIAGVAFFYAWAFFARGFFPVAMGVLMFAWGLGLMWLAFGGAKRLLRTRSQLRNEFLCWSGEQRRGGN